MFSSRSLADYKSLLIKLFPRGRAWQIEGDTLTAKVCEAMAEELKRVDQDIALIEREADPRYALDTLEDWEREYGLPDECMGPLATPALRRFALIRKIMHEGGQSEAFFQSLISAGSTALTITYQSPTTVPAPIPTPVMGKASKFIWYVDVPALIEEFFEAGDPADTLINETIDPSYITCLILKYKPAHSYVVFV